MEERREGERRSPDWGRREADRYIEEEVKQELKRLEQILGGSIESAVSRVQAEVYQGMRLIHDRLERENIPQRVRALEDTRRWWDAGLVSVCVVMSGFASLFIILIYDLRIRAIISAADNLMVSAVIVLVVAVFVLLALSVALHFVNDNRWHKDTQKRIRALEDWQHGGSN